MQEYPYVFLNDFLRYVLVAGSAYAIFYGLFKNKWLHRKIQNTVLSNSQIRFEMTYSFSTIIIFSLVGFSILKLKKAGFTRIYDDLAQYGYGWLLFSFLIIVLLHDTYFYWAHRLMHHPKLFKTVHLVHHKSTSPSPWAAYSFHPIEAVIEAAVFLMFVFLLPLHPLVLFAFTTYMIIRNVFGHLGIEILPKDFARSKWTAWHTTAVHHDMHHRHFNKNFGLYFSWWDRCLGTEHKDYLNQYENTTSNLKMEKN
jgi:Delta7-sterol 5-desaturase